MAYGVKELLAESRGESGDSFYKVKPPEDQSPVLDGSEGVVGSGTNYLPGTEPGKTGGGITAFAGDIKRSAVDLGDKLWNRSWAGAGARYALPRLTNPEMNWDEIERGKRVNEYRNEYDVSEKEAQDYVKYNITPGKVAEGQAMQKQREDEYIASKGGTLAAMGDYIVNNPGEFAGEMAMGIAADPELLLLGGAFKGVFQGMLKAGAGAKTAAATATATEAGLGSAIGAGGMALESREQTGEVDMEQVKMGGMIGGAAGGLIGAGMGVHAVLKRAGALTEAATGLATAEVQAAIVQYAKTNKVGMQVAAQKVMQAHGVDPGAIINEIDTVAAKLAKEAQEADPNFARSQALTMEQARDPKMGHIQQRPVTPGRNEAGPMKEMDGAERQRLQGNAGAKARSEMEANHIKDRIQGKVERLAEKEFMAANSDAASHAPLIERIAWKERQAAYGSSRDVSPSENLLDYPAYRPEPGALQKPILTTKEFQETALGQSKGGKPLTGAALQKRYDKWTREMQADHRDAKQVVTQGELEAIMTEKSPAMQGFFASQARIKGSRAKPLGFKGGQGGRGKGQTGNVNPKLLGIVGGMGLGALIGYSEKHDINDALKYMLAAGATLTMGAKLVTKFAKLHPTTKHLVKTKKGTTLGGLFNDWQGQGAVYDRKLMQIREAARTISGQSDEGGKGLVINKQALKMREDVTDALEDSTGKLFAALPDEGKELYKLARGFYKDWQVKGTERGILDDAIDNYVNHAYIHESLPGEQAVKDAFYGTQTRQQAMDTVHRRTRTIPTYKVAENVLGLKPRTKDIAELMLMYGKSMDLADRSKQLMETLKTTTAPDHNTNKLVMGMKRAPKNYVTISHPKFNGWKVHPDIAAVTKSMFSANDTGALKRGALWTSFFLKRNNVALSAFHMKALMMSYVMANGVGSMIKHPLRSTKEIINTFRGKSSALKSLKSTVNDETSRSIDEGIQNGLMIQAVDDIGKDTFYEGLDTITGVLDNAVPQKYGALIANTVGLPAKVAQKTLKAYGKANKVVDTVMWDRVYTGMKIQTYMNKMATLAARYGDTTPRAELAAQAAEFTNDAFGGLNWSRIAEGVDNKFGNTLAHQLTSPGARQTQQIMAFAPDWTTANVRVFYKAFANKKPMQQVMYMHYQLRGLLMSAMAGEAITYATTGQHIWEFADMTKIHMGDGTYWTFSKQFMEPMHWIQKPLQSGLNKMGNLPSMGLAGAMGQQYLRAGGQAPPISDIGYAKWATKRTLPIWMQQEGVKRKAQSLAGFPVYGTPKGTSGGGLRSYKGGRTKSRSKSRSSKR